MRIKEILNQHRRDFTAIYECEHCGHEYKSSGYDDSYFHNEVIPKMKCPICDKLSKDTYRPLTTKYDDSQIV